MKFTRIFASDDCTGSCFGTNLELYLKVKLLLKLKITWYFLKIIVIFKLVVLEKQNYEFSFKSLIFNANFNIINNILLCNLFHMILAT